MKKYIKVNQKGEVTSSYSEYMYISYSEKDKLKIGEVFHVDVVEADNEIGFLPIEKYSDETGKVFFEYIEVTPNEDLGVKEEINQLELDNAELMMKSAMLEMELSQSKNDVGELMIKVAMLEMGGNI